MNQAIFSLPVMLPSSDVKLKTVSDIVREDYRSAAVFKRHAINYCCGGKWPLEMVCGNACIDHHDLLREVALETSALQSVFLRSVFNWSTEFLMAYIREIYHVYLQDQLPHILSEIENFADGHRKKFKFLEALEPLVQELSTSLTGYLDQDRKIYARLDAEHNCIQEYKAGFGNKKAYLVSVLRKMRSVSNEYLYDDTACTSHRVAFSLLKELESRILDLIFLEEILLDRFPHPAVN
jgi:regulator of cell morphogenesis and NO signaling